MKTLIAAVLIIVVAISGKAAIGQTIENMKDRKSSNELALGKSYVR